MALSNEQWRKPSHDNALLQGIDGSACKPAHVQDIDYMVEKTYHLATYLDPFGVFLMPHLSIPISI